MLLPKSFGLFSDIDGGIADPMCRKCGTEEETSVHILCECEALASLRYIYVGSFFLGPDDIKKLGVGAIWRFGNAKRLL